MKTTTTLPTIDDGKRRHYAKTMSQSWRQIFSTNRHDEAIENPSNQYNNNQLTHLQRRKYSTQRDTLQRPPTFFINSICLDVPCHSNVSAHRWRLAHRDKTPSLSARTQNERTIVQKLMTFYRWGETGRCSDTGRSFGCPVFADVDCWCVCASLWCPCWKNASGKSVIGVWNEGMCVGFVTWGCV